MENNEQDFINIINATENNLKHVSLKIPKKQITVFTGVSGSGKSSLCLDTIAAESRRELNVTFPSFVQQFLPKYGRPEVDRMENLPVTIVIDQKKPAANSRSTVGTYTDIYALLRLLFSRVGKPFVGYSDSFSFNHPSGKCERCEGLGVVTELDIHKLVDFDKCLNDEGVIKWPAFTTGAWRWKRYAYSGLFDLNKKIKDYSKEEMDLFLYSPQIRLKNPPDNWPKSAKYEGIYPRMYRSIITSKEGQLHKKELDRIVSTFTCPVCHGARLNAKIRSCLINGKNICEVSDMPIPEAAEFIRQIEDHLLERAALTGNRSRFSLDAQRDALACCLALQAVAHDITEGGQLHRLKSHRFSAFIQSGQVNDILDERQQPLRFRADLARKRRHVLRLGNAARDDLRVTHDAGQRRFQLVRHIGCKFLPLLLGTLALGNIHDQQHSSMPCAVLLHRACRKFINAAVPLEFAVRTFAVERLLDHLNVIRVAAQRQIAAFRTVMREQRPRSVIGE